MPIAAAAGDADQIEAYPRSQPDEQHADSLPLEPRAKADHDGVNRFLGRSASRPWKHLQKARPVHAWLGGKGTGLGLSQVYGFAKQSGGEIEVSSEPGSGTCFTLYLPRVYHDPSRVEPESLPSTVPAGGHILVVEDNAAMGEFAIQTLTDLGYEVELVGDAGEALSRLNENGLRFDAMFSDVVMPGMNGIELARIVGGHWPELPIILTSG